MGMHVRMYVLYVLSAGLHVCMYDRIVVVIMSVVGWALRNRPLVHRDDVFVLTAVELGLGEVENGPRSDGALPSFGWEAHPDGFVC